MRLTRRRAATGLVLAALAAGGVGWWTTKRATAQVPAPPVMPARSDSLPTTPPQPSTIPIPSISLPAPVVIDSPRTEVTAARPTGRTVVVSQPAGGFVRAFADGESIRLQFDADRLTVTVAAAADRPGAEVYLEADYAMSKDGVVYGLITAAEAAGGPADRLQRLVGEPFAARVRVDGDSLSLRDVRCGAVPADELEWVSRLAQGRYTPAGPPAARKPVKPPFVVAPPISARPIELPTIPPPTLPTEPPQSKRPPVPLDNKQVFSFGPGWFGGQ